MARILSERFSEILKTIYKDTVFLEYIQPYMVLPLFLQDEPMMFELEELFKEDEKKKFAFFNRPNGDFHLHDADGNQVRLPHAFTHWTYEATGGLFMITDL